MTFKSLKLINFYETALELYVDNAPPPSAKNCIPVIHEHSSDAR